MSVSASGRTVSDRATTLEDAWKSTWPQALASWSPYTLLREPVFFRSDQDARSLGMAGEIAAIRLNDQVVMVNLKQVAERGLADHAVEVLAHEIGHHVYVPGNLADNARMIAAMKPVLFGLHPDTVHLVANLYGDLLINDRLQRRAGIDIAAVYRKLRERTNSTETSRVWKVYTRTYEHLWRLAPGTLSPRDITTEVNADAALIARLIRHYATDWLRGARRFACILFPYLHEDEQERRRQTFTVVGLDDTRCAGKCAGAGSDAQAIPDGITTIDPAELGLDDEFDRELDDVTGLGASDENDQRRTGAKTRKVAKPPNTAPDRDGEGRPGRQCREPYEYGELLRSLGLNLAEHEVTTRYYRERALPHLIPFPTRKAPRVTEPLAEGYELWEPGDALEAMDLFGSIMQSPHVVPGITTVQRVYGETPGCEPARVPLDLDVYVDCSGSMPNPAVSVSYLALSATILVLSALRAGARVQATLWSGAGQFETTAGFVRDEKRLLGIVTGYIAGSTAFPLHVLRDTYSSRKPSEPPAHIVIISDDGSDTILERDERGTPGKEICAMALDAARGGGTMVLNLPNRSWSPRQTLENLGFRIHAVTDWEALVAFARAFVRENYGQR